MRVFNYSPFKFSVPMAQHISSSQFISPPPLPEVLFITMQAQRTVWERGVILAPMLPCTLIAHGLATGRENPMGRDWHPRISCLLTSIFSWCTLAKLSESASFLSMVNQSPLQGSTVRREGSWDICSAHTVKLLPHMFLNSPCLLFHTHS